MSRMINNCTKRYVLLFIPFLLLMVSSSVHAQWTPVTPPAVSTDWYLSGVHFASADEGWAVGVSYAPHSGVLLHYATGTWTPVTPPAVSTAWYLWGVHFTSADEGWAVGSSFTEPNSTGVLLHYAAGTWTPVTPPAVSTDWYLEGVHFTSADEGWAVGHNAEKSTGVLLHYLNGVWTSVTPPTVSVGGGIAGVHFTSAHEGWAVGSGNGTLLHYLNGVWTSVTPPAVSTYWQFHSVHFTSADEGWAVGYDWEHDRGALLHYLNGTWTSITPPTVSTYRCLWGVHFTSADEGWAVGDGGLTLLHYLNGTWTSVTPPAVSGGFGVYAVHFTSPSEGWAVGRDWENGRGVLLHYPPLALLPNEGTIGTQFTITGSNFGTKRGKVLIGGVATKIAKDGWKPDSITCTVTKVPAFWDTPHDVTITSKEIGSISLPEVFTVKLLEPVIDPGVNDHGAAGNPITINGNFFGTKKGKVYLEYLGKNKNCKVTNWTMNSITFLIPKKLAEGSCLLNISNKIGGVYGVNFTIDPPLPASVFSVLSKQNPVRALARPHLKLPIFALHGDL